MSDIPFKQRAAAVATIAGEVSSIEDALQSSLGHIGRAIHVTCSTSLELGAPMAITSPALRRLAEAAIKQAEACEEVGRAHKLLVTARAGFVPEISYGDDGPCPGQPKEWMTQRKHIQAVA